MFWVKQRFCSSTRNSGIADLVKQRIFLENLEFVFGSNIVSLVVPETLESVFCMKQRFCGRSKNSGNGDAGQTEILCSFLKFRKHR